ncbi:uncharacterized protein [Diadema antillarum]|uniref:uncharacterized protein n=1 Tax=Diadema antillarum TaxID=105358 RepID=UPI003A85C2B0
MAIVKSSYDDVSIPTGMSVIDFVFEKFDEYGDTAAVVDGLSGRSYTYAQVKLFSHRIASALCRQGYRKGDVFGIMSPNIPEFVLMLCGIGRMGGVVSGVNPLYTADELVRQMEAAGAQMIITVPPFAEKVLEAKSRLPRVKAVYVFGEADGCQPFEDLLADDGSAFPTLAPSLDDLFALPFSSGTTGVPKGVVMTNKMIIWNITQLESNPEILDDAPGENMLALLPYFHCYGLVVIMLHGLRCGTRQICMSRFEPEAFLKIMQDYEINVAYLVPPIMLFLAKHPLVEKYDLSSLRMVTSGAAPLGGDIAAALKSRTGVKCIRQGFGMTELGPVSHVLPKSVDVPSSVGLLLPNTEAKIVDIQTGELLGAGQDGELCIRGPQVMGGYLENPEATANTIDEDGFLHTGDIGHYDDRELFYIVDRLKELVKYKGYQVPPAELEALLLTHPKISDAAVIGVPDEEAGELPKAYIVRVGEELTESDVVEFVAGKVAPYKKLRGGVEFVATIPKSASGKILRRILKGGAVKS